MVDFGLRYALRQPDWVKTDLADRYAACVEQCVWADKLGFSKVMLSEHHGVSDGYLPSPFVLAGAIAARTEQMRLHLSAIIAPLHNPVRLAEDLAILDVLSNGRAEPVLVGGYVGTEFDLLGTSLDDRKNYMEDIIPFLRLAWTGEPFEWKGKRYHITPKPVQKPHIPVWMGGGSLASARRAARHADAYIPQRQELYDVFYDELKKLGKSKPKEELRYIVVWVAEDPDKFWAELAPYVLHENNSYGEWYRDWDPKSSHADAWNSFVVRDDTDELRETGLYPVLTPDETIARARELGPNGFVMLHPMVGGTPPEMAWEMLELVANRVMPALRE